MKAVAILFILLVGGMEPANAHVTKAYAHLDYIDPTIGNVALLLYSNCQVYPKFSRKQADLFKDHCRYLILSLVAFSVAAALPIYGDDYFCITLFPRF